jgi:hypothetical protein
MAKTKRLQELPKFPDNPLGLKRGSILEAIHPDVNQLMLAVGQRILIGYDGEHIRCGPFTWSVEQIVDEINKGIWKVIVGEDFIDLSDPEESREFALIIEHIDLISINPNILN